MRREAIFSLRKVVDQKPFGRKEIFEFGPTRWIVERSIAWFNWYRRLGKDFEADIETSENWTYIASIGMLPGKV
jgi:transposase